MAFYRASVGLFVAAYLAGMGGALAFAWPGGWTWTLVLLGLGLGLAGFVLGAAAAFFSRPPENWWRALAIGLALFIASLAAVPFASAFSSASYFWAHRAEADQVVSQFPDRNWASATSSGRRCDGLSTPECDEIGEALDDFGGIIVSGGDRNGVRKVKLHMRGDYNILYCPAPSTTDCFSGWAVPLGGDWYLVPF